MYIFLYCDKIIAGGDGMEYYSIDKIESDFAILEDTKKNTFKVSLNLLPKGVKETDVVFKKNARYYIDKDKSKEIKLKVQALQDEIFGTE